MSILMLQPVFKDAIWGGKLLKNFGYEEAGDNAGECWGISAHQNGDCTVANGEFAGKKLSWCYENHRELFGNIKEDVFPLLIKIIGLYYPLLYMHLMQHYVLHQNHHISEKYPLQDYHNVHHHNQVI